MPPYNNNHHDMHQSSMMLVIELNDMVDNNHAVPCVKNTSLVSRLDLDENLVGCCRTVSFEEEPELVSTKVSSKKKKKKMLQKKKKQVSFSIVQEREYDIILGDHPFCPDWLPLSLDWTYQQNADTSVDQYEKKKAAKRTKSSKTAMPKKLSLEEREARLQRVYGIC